MTNQYKQSMAKREHEFTCNYLSKTATTNNIRRMRPDVKKLCRQPGPIAFEDTADVVEVSNTTERFVKAVDRLSENPMKTIPEEDELGTTQPQRGPTEGEKRQMRQAISNANYYENIKDTDKIETSFRARLSEIYSAHYSFICTPAGNHPRPRWAQISRMDQEVNDHVTRVAYAKQELISDVTQLRTFLREQLFDQYCLMKDTPMEKKNRTWLQYRRCIISRVEIGKHEMSMTKGDC